MVRLLRSSVTTLVMLLLLAGCAPAIERGGTALPAVASKSPQLTERDVGALLADMRSEPLCSDTIDAPLLSRSILLKLPLEYTADGLGSSQERSARLDEAVAVYRGLERARGATSTLMLLMDTQFTGEGGEGGKARELRSEEASIAPLLGGLEFMNLMVGDGQTPMFNWKVKSVSVSGTSTAVVSYEASPTTAAEAGQENPLRFADPDMCYEKILEFEHSTGRWRLSGWSNFSQFEQQLASNVRPKSLSDHLGWWLDAPPE